MISISLDPDIVIQTYEHYIQIRGVIILTGDYRKVPPYNRKFSDSSHRRTFHYIEKVIDQDDERAYFSHRFPVEITVNKSRIDRVEDISVTVDSFDYELIAKDLLQVYASLHIFGIKPEYTSRRTVSTNKQQLDNKATGMTTTSVQPDELLKGVSRRQRQEIDRDDESSRLQTNVQRERTDGGPVVDSDSQRAIADKELAKRINKEREVERDTMKDAGEKHREDRS